MNEKQKEHTRAWIAALRSGKYTQAQYVLHVKNGGHCCLGVAYEVRAKFTHTKSWFDGDIVPGKLGAIAEKFIHCMHTADKESRTIGASTRLFFGINPDDADKLADMNDSGKSFAEIADYIEVVVLDRDWSVDD